MNVTYSTQAPVSLDKLKTLFEPLIVIHVTDFDDESYKKFTEDFARASAAPQPIIPVLIDSFGGEVYSCLGMMDVLESSKKPIVTIVQSKAMSCGAALFSCGDKGFRYASPSSTFLVHEVSSESGGKVTDQQIDLEEAVRLNNLMLQRISKSCGKRPTFMEKALKEKGGDYFITAKEAKDMGLVSHIGIPNLNIKVQVDFEIKS